MKKIILALLIILMASMAWADNKTVYIKTALTGGGTGAMDAIDGSDLDDGEICFVYVNSRWYEYVVDADSGEDESSPDVIAPDSNAGDKRFVLQRAYVDGTTLDDIFSNNGILVRTGAKTYSTITDNSANWDTAYGWGDHSGAGYLTEESDPGVTTHESTYNHSNYNAAYGWGDHSEEGYLKTESDPAVTTHESTYDHGNYNTAYGWGNHADAGYLTEEVDGSVSNEINTITGDDSNATSGLGITLSGAGSVSTSVSGDTVTITGTDTNTQLTEEQVEDFVGGMLGGTETLITVTYQDETGDIDFVVDNDLHNYSWANVVDADITDTLTSSSCTGNAATCTTASAGDAAVDFFGAGVSAVTDATACTDIEGTGLSITENVLNWSASGIAGHDTFTDFVANEHIDWTQDQGATNIHAGNYTDTDTTYTGTANEITLTDTTFSLHTDITRDAEWNTEGEVETVWGAVNILLETEIDASSELAAIMDDETGTGALVFGTSPTFTTNITTPQITIIGANADPDAAGELLYDNSITGMSGGGLRWYDDNSVRLLVDLESDPSDDDYVVAYDADADGFYMKQDANSGGATAWDDIGNPDANDEIDMGAYTIELNVEDLRIGDGGDNYVKFNGGAMTFEGTADVDLPDDSIDAADINTINCGTGCTWDADNDEIDVDAATDSEVGAVELATIAEVNTGTDTGRAVTPDALAGSIYGEKTVYIKVIANDTALATGDGKAYFTVPDNLNGMNLVDVDCSVYTVSSSGTPTFQVHNLTDTQDMLSTLVTIDASEYSSYTAATQPVINTTYDDVATGDRLRLDCDVAGTGTKGWDFILTFQTP